MHRFLSSRRHRRIRILWMLVLVVSMLVQPALSAVGQVHDAFEHAGATLTHHEAEENHGADVGVLADASGAIHFLLHYAHCCASTTAILAVPSDMKSMPFSQVRQTSLSDRERDQTRPGNPLRPPILG